ncbi:MAG: alpha/beta fold hydrolase [Rhizomicrobium sp.]
MKVYKFWLEVKSMNDLIAIPGLGSDSAVWSRTLNMLHDDFRCTVGDTLHDGSISEMAHRILRAAPDWFFVAGLSMGGMVALEIMRFAPERVAGLAIIDSNGFPDTPQETEHRRQTIAAIRDGIDLRRTSEAGLVRLIHPDAPMDVREEIKAMGLRVGGETYARQVEAVLNRPDQRSVLEAIKAPTIFVTGADDLMIPPDRARAMADMVPGAELVVINNCGHLPPIEMPRATADALKTLISRGG